MPRFHIFATVLGLAALSGIAGADAQPRSFPPASKDAMAAPAGTYQLDPHHTSVIARVGHMNTVSISTFRFGGVSGSLDWRPGQIEASKIDIEIQMNSIETPVGGFSAELQGEKFLNTAKYPTAHFVSTSITRTGPDAGTIVGQLTFMGQTRPMTITAEMVGVGRTMKGAPVVGFSGKSTLNRADFGYTALLPVISNKIDFEIDTEFDKAG